MTRTDPAAPNLGDAAPGAVPALFRGLFDDAAVFPPGSATLPDALEAHRRHTASWYADAVGPLVVGPGHLDLLTDLGNQGPPPRLTVAVPDGPAGLPAVLASSMPLHAVEVAVPTDLGVEGFLDALARALDAGAGPRPQVAVEVPRDERRGPLLGALAGTGHEAKFRTGGVRADLVPGDAELAAAILAAVTAGVAFKATAGLHHALRNIDPHTGARQHGFLHVLLATDAALHGADPAHVRGLLAGDDPHVPERVAALTGPRGAALRARFTSFGTCSISEPLDDLLGLGLLDEPDRSETPGSPGRTP